VEDHRRVAQMLADFAALGIRNGRRILQLQRLGLRDRDTAAYNLSYFTDYASKEIYKARRYARTFSLLTFSIDNLANIRLRLGPDDARRATRGIIRALNGIIRDSDVIAKASDQEFYLLLPETDFFGALMFVRRAMTAVREEPEVKEIEERLPVALIGGAATFPKDGEDFDELVHRCRRRMDERRVSLQRKLMLDGLPFWDEVELLLGGPESPRLPTDERAEPSRRGKVSDVLFEELQTEVSRELLRDPAARGLLYVGAGEVRADLAVAQGLEATPPEFGARVYVLGRRADLDSHPALTPVFLEGDERIARHEFLLWLSEHSAYALLQRRGRGATWGFHTSDPAVVDGLISRLQAEYDLQPW
jgi:two-component system, cell cycle response regulator